MWLTPKTTWKTSDYMLPTTYNPLLKGGLNSMNNYQNGVMPYSECTVMDSNHRTQMGADLQSAVVAA